MSKRFLGGWKGIYIGRGHIVVKMNFDKRWQGVYQPGKPGILRGFSKTGKASIMSGNFHRNRHWSEKSISSSSETQWTTSVARHTCGWHSLWTGTEVLSEEPRELIHTTPSWSLRSTMCALQNSLLLLRKWEIGSKCPQITPRLLCDCATRRGATNAVSHDPIFSR